IYVKFMRKNLLAVIAISVTLLLSSCAGLTNITTPQTVALNQGNFKFVKTVCVETYSHYVLLFGGISRSAKEDVVEKLIEAADLQPNQALADIRIKYTNEIWALGIYIRRILTASASVVEFEDSETNAFAKSEKGKMIELDETLPKIKDIVIDSISGIDMINEPLAEAENVVDKEPEIQYIRELAYNKLLQIKESIINETEKDRAQTIEEYKKIKKWYYTIDSTYMEIEKLLKEIKKLL
ncbi:MAG: hypothetical protein IKY54_05870, partial [Muribaculaceae bacterium]|nr:hypothetical protein [Muribaculaceae bacterium]